MSQWFSLLKVAHTFPIVLAIMTHHEIFFNDISGISRLLVELFSVHKPISLSVSLPHVRNFLFQLSHQPLSADCPRPISLWTLPCFPSHSSEIHSQQCLVSSENTSLEGLSLPIASLPSPSPFPKSSYQVALFYVVHTLMKKFIYLCCWCTVIYCLFVYVLSLTIKHLDECKLLRP